MRAEFFREMPMDQTIVIENATFEEVDPSTVMPAIAAGVKDGKLKSPKAAPAMTLVEELCTLIESGSTAKITAVEPKRVRFEMDGPGWRIFGSFKKGDLAY